MTTWPPVTHQDVQDAIGYLRGRQFPSGHRYVALGDSITIAGDTSSTNTFADSYPHYLSIFSGGALRLVRNAGVGGDTTAQMLARFDTDVTPYSPDVVTVLGGQNDMFQAISDDTYRTNIRAIVGKIRNIGAVPVLFTMNPDPDFDVPATTREARNNRWLVEYAGSQGILIVDVFTALVDPTSANGFASGYLSATVPGHPSELGYAAIGRTAWNALKQFFPPPPFPVSPNAGDVLNMVPNGFFLTDTSGWGQGWGPSAGTATFTRVADATMPGGFVGRISLTGAVNANDQARWTRSITTGFSVGDRIRASVLVNSSGTVGPQFHVDQTGYTGSFSDSRVVTYSDITHGYMNLEFTVQPGVTALVPWLGALARGTGGGTGTVDFGAVTMVNLTTANLLTL